MKILSCTKLMPQIYQHNLSSAEKVRKEEGVIVLKAERMEEVDFGKTD